MSKGLILFVYCHKFFNLSVMDDLNVSVLVLPSTGLRPVSVSSISTVGDSVDGPTCLKATASTKTYRSVSGLEITPCDLINTLFSFTVILVVPPSNLRVSDEIPNVGSSTADACLRVFWISNRAR